MLQINAAKNEPMIPLMSRIPELKSLFWGNLIHLFISFVSYKISNFPDLEED